MGNSSFEHSFRRAINAVKANVNPKTGERSDLPRPTSGDETHIASVPLGGEGEHRVYDFWQRSGTREDILGSLVSIRGPAYNERRREWSKMKELVGFVEPGGKVKYTKPGRYTREAVDEAVRKFWDKMGLHAHEAQGWDVSSWFKDSDPSNPATSAGVRVLRRKKSGLMEEYAVARPKPHGHTLDYWTPETGDVHKRLPYEKSSKIPTNVGNRIREIMVEQGFFNSGKTFAGSSAPGRLPSIEESNALAYRTAKVVLRYTPPEGGPSQARSIPFPSSDEAAGWAKGKFGSFTIHTPGKPNQIIETWTVLSSR
jgi:hypothetical protein